MNLRWISKTLKNRFAHIYKYYLRIYTFNIEHQPLASEGGVWSAQFILDKKLFRLVRINPKVYSLFHNLPRRVAHLVRSCTVGNIIRE